MTDLGAMCNDKTPVEAERPRVAAISHETILAHRLAAKKIMHNYDNRQRRLDAIGRGGSKGKA